MISAMNRILFRTLAIAVVIAICSSTAWADSRRGHRGDNRQQPTEQRGQRVGGADKKDHTRDKNKNDRHDKKHKPDNGKNSSLGRRPAPRQRPGAGQPAVPDRWERNKHKPASPAHRPSTPHRPPHRPVPPPPRHHAPAPRPNFHHGFAPHPPHAPFYVHAPRPIPHRPHSWHPAGRHISFGQALLGLTLGAAFNASLNYLYDNGYTVGGYGNNAIYINNVNMLNFIWPEASMFYNGGRLVSTVYTYVSPYNDGSRYNSVLNILSGRYGAPYVSPLDNGMSATWWNSDGSYVTLNYESSYGHGGALGYYTTLTFGN